MFFLYDLHESQSLGMDKINQIELNYQIMVPYYT